MLALAFCGLDENLEQRSLNQALIFNALYVNAAQKNVKAAQKNLNALEPLNRFQSIAVQRFFLVVILGRRDHVRYH